MPELPEVATMVRSFRSRLVGRHVRHVLTEPELFPGTDQDALARALTGAEVTGVARRGKYVRIDFAPPEKPLVRMRPPVPAAAVAARRPATLAEVLAGGAPEKPGRSRPATPAERARLVEGPPGPPPRPAAAASLILHLRMTGRYFLMNDNGHPLPRTTRMILAVEDPEDDLLFGIKDTRRLAEGALRTGRAARAWPGDLKLGPDALTARLTGAKLAARLSGALPIKAALLDQARMAGLGNIYASEALFRAGIHPERSARTLTAEEWIVLAAAIPDLLRTAMKRWCELSQFTGPAVEGYGDFRGELAVYDRRGEPCRRCGAPVRMVRQAGRTTYFCAGCQA